MRDSKNFSTNVEGVTVKYSNGNVELVGLVPEKQYKTLLYLILIKMELVEKLQLQHLQLKFLKLN